MNAPIVYLNHEFMPLAEAKVSPLDRGFLFADGVYEVIPVYGGKAFRLREHLDRLQRSLEGIRLSMPLTHRDWTQAIDELIRHNGGGELSIYLQITRGAAAYRDHAFPTGVAPTVFMMATTRKPPEPALLAMGVRAITLDDIRWRYCHLKTIALLPNILLRQEAIDHGCTEAILVRDDLVTEGAASNVFIVYQGTLMTPPRGPFLLPGITRDLLLELADEHCIPCREADITRDMLTGASEVWLTSSTREILPVTEIDEQAVGTGEPGPVWARMMAHYRVYTDLLRSGDAA